jgi:hypothetical protein
MTGEELQHRLDEIEKAIEELPEKIRKYLKPNSGKLNEDMIREDLARELGTPDLSIKSRAPLERGRNPHRVDILIEGKTPVYIEAKAIGEYRMPGERYTKSYALVEKLGGKYLYVCSNPENKKYRAEIEKIFGKNKVFYLTKPEVWEDLVAKVREYTGF